MLLVTGSAGFIGSCFVRMLMQSGEERTEPVISLDALTYAGNLDSLKDIQNNPNHFFVQGSVCDTELLEKLFEKYPFRAVVHFAAESHVDRSINNPDEFIQTNIVGTYQLLKASLNYYQTLSPLQKSKFRFLHVSTDEVFGSLKTHDVAFSESTAYDPKSPYSASKASSDHLVRAWGHTYGLPILVTNCSNNYGPYQFPEKLIPLMILNALAGKSLPVYGDGLNVRDWLYVEDHCRAIRCVLERGTIGETYCIGGSCEKTNREVVHTLCSILDNARPLPEKNSSYQELITYVKDRPGHDRRYAINAQKIKDALGWIPHETFETGLRKTITWYLNHEAWVQSVQTGAYRTWIDTMDKHYTQKEVA